MIPEGGPRYLAVTFLLVSLAGALQRTTLHAATRFLDVWEETLEDLIERKSYLTLEDEQDMTGMYTEVRRRVE